MRANRKRYLKCPTCTPAEVGRFSKDKDHIADSRVTVGDFELQGY